MALIDVYLLIPISPQSHMLLRLGEENGGGYTTSAIQSPPIWSFNGGSSRPTSSSGDRHIWTIFFFFAPSREKLQEDLGRARSHLETLGWIVNLQKSNFNPAQQVFRLPDKLGGAQNLPSGRKEESQGCSSYAIRQIK